MTTDALYLICHKVRDDRAFDVAIRMDCPCCDRRPDGLPINATMPSPGVFIYEQCNECDGLGYWWIIPTSGHRAYPVTSWPLAELIHEPPPSEATSVLEEPTPSLADAPDHYTTCAAVYPHGTLDKRPEFLRALLRKALPTINRRGL